MNVLFYNIGIVAVSFMLISFFHKKDMFKSMTITFILAVLAVLMVARM